MNAQNQRSFTASDMLKIEGTQNPIVYNAKQNLAAIIQEVLSLQIQTESKKAEKEAAEVISRLVTDGKILERLWARHDSKVKRIRQKNQQKENLQVQGQFYPSQQNVAQQQGTTFSQKPQQQYADTENQFDRSRL